MDDDIKSRRSKVRMNVTYAAMLFVFLGGALLIAYFVLTDKSADAKDTFNIILPVGTAVITYWFAARSADKAVEQAQSATEINREDEKNET